MGYDTPDTVMFLEHFSTVEWRDEKKKKKRVKCIRPNVFTLHSSDKEGTSRSGSREERERGGGSEGDREKQIDK